VLEIDKLTLAKRTPIRGTKEQEKKPIPAREGAKGLWFSGLVDKRNLWCLDPRLQADNLLAKRAWQ
jgi:hypothetical protein